MKLAVHTINQHILSHILIRGFSKRSPGIFIEEVSLCCWKSLSSILRRVFIIIFRIIIGCSVAAVVDLCYIPVALHVRTCVCTFLVTRATTWVILFCPSSACLGRTSNEQVSVPYVAVNQGYSSPLPVTHKLLPLVFTEFPLHIKRITF